MLEEDRFVFSLKCDCPAPPLVVMASSDAKSDVVMGSTISVSTVVSIVLSTVVSTAVSASPSAATAAATAPPPAAAAPAASTATSATGAVITVGPVGCWPLDGDDVDVCGDVGSISPVNTLIFESLLSVFSLDESTFGKAALFISSVDAGSAEDGKGEELEN